MNSPDPYTENELDCLVRKTLKTRVGSEEPPDYIWGQIKQQLISEKTKRPVPQTPWLPLAVQSVLTVLLVILGFIGLQMQIGPGEVQFARGELLVPVSTVYVKERVASSSMAAISEELDLQMLRSLSRARIWNRGGPDAEQPTRAPQDVPPNMASPEGRALKSDFSFWRLLREGQNTLQSGPDPGLN
jgi:hypothetical protein